MGIDHPIRPRAMLIVAVALAAAAVTLAFSAVTKPAAADSVGSLAIECTPYNESCRTIPQCYRGDLLITDVRRSGRKVVVEGVGRKGDGDNGRVNVRSGLTNRVVARTTLNARGHWRVSIKAPAKRLWKSNRTRYQATMGRSKTGWVKLTRRMGSTSATLTSPTRLRIRGSVSRPLARGARASVTVSRNCGRYQRSGQIRIAKNGRFSGTVKVAAQDEVYFMRISAQVRRPGSRRTLVTYSIIQPVLPVR